MDLGTIIGISVAAIGILLGQVLEGGSVLQIIQPTAALIVFGGTIGATMIGFPLETFKRAMVELVFVFKDDEAAPNEVIDQVIEFTNKARREGIISLEKDAADVKDPFFQKSIMMAVDGSEPRELRETMEVELQYMEERGEHSAKIFEAAGGYAPTIGIIGAVLGLIVVMQSLDDIDAVGHGIGMCANLSWKLKRLQTLWFDGIGRNNIKPVRERSRDEQSVTFGEETQEVACAG